MNKHDRISPIQSPTLTDPPQRIKKLLGMHHLLKIKLKPQIEKKNGKKKKTHTK